MIQRKKVVFSGVNLVRAIAVDVIENNNIELAAFALTQSGGLSNFLSGPSFYSTFEKRSAIVNHHFDSSKRFDKKFGNARNDIHFYFDHQLHSNLLININSINHNTPSSATSINQFFSGIHVNRTGREENTNFIESFTNKEIKELINSNGYFFESKNFNRQNQFGAKDYGIGGYRITTADGKTYHYSQPVYQYEEFYRQLTPKADSDTNNPENFSEHKFYHEQRKTEPYATHWLLTAITGPDYVKRSANNIRYPSVNDYGYWVRFDYGAWTDGFVWRTPKEQKTYNNLVFDKTNATNNYSWGRKQLVYLNKVVTRSHTALFVKSIREDSESAQIGYLNSGPFTIDKFPSYEGDDYVYYPKQKSLKLDEIILVKNKDDNTNTNNFAGDLVSNPNSTVNVSWNTMSDISYGVNNQNNVLDNLDLIKNSEGNYVIYDKAVKVIKLQQDYTLAKDTNTNQGRLTLNSVDFLAKTASKIMPAYNFNYIDENTKYEYCEDYENCDKDAWGYHKNKTDLWSLNSIKTPLGSEIKIEYEEDDYYTEAFSRRFWTEGLTFKVENYNDDEYKITVRNSPEYVEDAQIDDFSDYFEMGQKVSIDLWISRRKNCIEWFDQKKYIAAFDLNPRILADEFYPEVIIANSENLIVKVSKRVNYGDLLNRPNIRGTSFEPGLLLKNEFWKHNNCPVTHYYDAKKRGESPAYVSPGVSGCSDHHSMYIGLIANKTPVADSGGGIRAKSIATYSNTGEFFKVAYNYDHPTMERSSGITSYAPVRGYKYVAYQSELPGPKVNYEYVTMSQVGEDGSSLGSTQYHFDVLKPAVNIFSKSLNIGNHFKSEVVEHDLPRKTLGADVKLYDNTAMIGSLLEVSEFNSKGHLIRQKTNNYKNFTELANSNNGSIQESFLSMKSIHDFHALYVKVPFNYGIQSPDGSAGINVKLTKNIYFESLSNLNTKKRFANVSTKITYPLIQKSNTIIQNGFKTTNEFFNPDPKTGDFLNTRTTLANGTTIENIKIPAYTKYPDMGSKVDRVTNRNMLTQEAMNITKSGNLITNATITTWNPNWIYTDAIGNTSTQNGVWRKHKTFVWEGSIGSSGSYFGFVGEDDHFNWGVAAAGSETVQSNPKWKNTSTVTKYTHWSSPIETRDINNNFAASKMADDFTKVIATGNARQSELFYSGAEYNPSGNYTEGAILGANYRSQDAAHTGNWSLKTTSSSNKLFEINKAVSSRLSTNAMRPGNYRVSYWVKDPQTTGITSSRSHLMVNGVEVFVSETVTAGCWKQFNYTITIPVTSTAVNIYVKNDHSNVYYDDFRMHPIYASMSSYVYNQDTDELVAILGANNMASVFCYDKAGRLCASYAEAVNGDTHIGGFKVVSQNKYNYADGTSNYLGCECVIDRCGEQVNHEPLKVLSVDNICTAGLRREYEANVTGGSGNYKYEWSWLINAEEGQYTNFIEGNRSMLVPYAVKKCDTENNKFNRVWKARVKVTDQVTAEVANSSGGVTFSGCNLYIDENYWYDLEVTKCLKNCSNSDYTFKVHTRDPNMSGNFKYEYIYYNPITKTNSDWIDVTASDGEFCPQIFNREWSNCASGYVKNVTLGIRITNLSTGQVSGTSGPAYSVYLGCSDVPPSPQYRVLPNYVGKEKNYINEDTIIEIDSEGEVISVRSINGENLKQ